MSWVRFCIFRHGQTDWNREGRFQGHLDVPLNELGHAQARALMPKLKEAGVQAILSSDLMRAYETARLATEGLGIPIFPDPRLREAHLGEAQGKTREEIEAAFGAEVVRRWRSSDITDAEVSYTGGESGRAVMERAFAAIEAFGRSRDYECVGISTHGGVVRRIMQRVLPPGSEPVPIPNGVLYQLEYHLETHQWRVRS